MYIFYEKLLHELAKFAQSGDTDGESNDRGDGHGQYQFKL